MSERFAWMFVLVITVAGGLGWSHYRRLQGRAEQKKEDAIWFAAHPVVKEVSPTIDYNKLVFWKDASGAICRLDDSFPERNYTCLDLPKPHDGLCEGWAGIWWGPRPCPVLRPAPPKKAKPAKRRKAGLPIPVCAQHYDDGKTEFARCQPAKANCSMPLNHGTATVYWPPREDGKCYPQDSPFQP